MASWKGGEKLKRTLEEMARKLGNASEVRAGFPEGSTYPDGTPLATAAAANNYGAPAKGIPPRPFFTNAITQHRNEWGKALSMELRRVDFDARQALELAGVQMAGDLAASLVATNSPALSPVTLLLRERFPDRTNMAFADVLAARSDVASGKASGLSGTGAKPLVWTGKMLNHLQGPQAWSVS